MQQKRIFRILSLVTWAVCVLVAGTAVAQLTDNTQTPHTENSGIGKSLADQIGIDSVLAWSDKT